MRLACVPAAYLFLVINAKSDCVGATEIIYKMIILLSHWIDFPDSSEAESGGGQ